MLRSDKLNPTKVLQFRPQVISDLPNVSHKG